MAELKRGSLLKGRYRVGGVIGQGAMGAVYEARDETLPGATWALKVLCEADLEPEEVSEAVGLFRREADICARLRHPGLPGIVDFFSENGCHVLVMERIFGETLDTLVDRRRRPFTEAEMLPILIQLASCLQYLHEQRPHPIIFRDLKPSNCMVTPAGKVTLIDFGIARFHKPGRKSDTVVIGTPGFCAPEQYGGAQTEPRSDLYSLGALAWHLLSGEDPSAVGFSFPPLRAVAPTVSSATAEIVARCVAFDPAGRYPSATELLADLQWASASALSSTAAAVAPARSFRTQRLQRAAKQHLSASPTPAAAAAAPVFCSVRPQAEHREPGPSLDGAFLASWARRVFRVWWGPGSIYTSRVLALLFMVMVLGTFAHLLVHSDGGRGSQMAATELTEYRRADSCLEGLELVRDRLDAWKGEHGRYPSSVQFAELTAGVACPVSHRRYDYLPTTDLRNYVVRCNGVHATTTAGHPELDSRTRRIVWAEVGR